MARTVSTDLELRTEARDPEDRAVQRCMQAYLDELAAALPGGFDPKRSVSADPDELRPPDGGVLVLMSGEATMGCGAFKRLEPGVAEIKRMWLAPRARGQGLGRVLLAALESACRAAGHRIVRLDTNAHLEAAIGLYRSSGYRERSAYNDNPYAALWFEKVL